MLFGILPVLAFSQPANDDCTDRTTISVLTATPSSYSIDLTNATESIDASCDGNAANDYLDVWYEFTMPVDGNIRVTDVNGLDGFSIFDSCGGTELTCFYGNDFAYNLTAATTYVLRVARRSIYADVVSFDIQAFETIANDECADRIPITVTTGGVSSYSVDLRKASESLNASCDGNVANDYLDVWYEFTMPVDGNIRVTDVNGLDGFSIFDSCGGTELTCFYGNDFAYNLTAATTYVLRVARRSIYADVVSFDIQAFETIANDECADRIPITVTTGGVSSYSVDLRKASESLNASCDGNVANDYLDVWYEFTMPVDGNIRVTDVNGLDGFSIFDSCGGTELTCFYGNDFAYNLTAATTYVLRVARRSIYADVVSFDIQAFETIANDECADRIPITVTTGGVSSYSVDLRKASESLNASCDGNVANDYLDVWYEFTMPVDGNIRVTDVNGLDGFSIFDSCGGTELTCFYGNDFAYNLTAATTYVLRVARRSIYADIVDFDIQAFESAENDDCINATYINVGIVDYTEVTQDHRKASESIDASCDNASQINLDLWYEFVMPVNGNIEISNIGGLDGVSLFDGCAGTELDCFDGNGLFFGLTSGTTYYLRSSKRDIYADIITFRIQAIEAPLAPCATTTQFVGGAWDNGLPNMTTNAIIRSNYNTSTHGSFSACSLAIDASTFLTINSGDFVEVAFNIDVNGTLNVEHEASLVQRDDASVTLNNGAINVLVTTPELDGRDFMLMGSPMSAETTTDVLNGVERVRNHLTENFTPNAAVAATSPGAGNWLDEEGDDWPVYAGTINPGEGYMIMRSVTGPATALNLSYNEGTLNNGLITYSATFNSDQNSSPNIIANPYASPILADDFINSNATIVDAVYFWEHRTSPNSGNPGPYGLDYTMEDISIYNLTGGTAAAGSDPSTTPNGVIATAQGFGIKALAAGDISFSNVMRRTSGNTTLRSLNNDRIWLNVQSDRYDLNSTALIGFLAQASEQIDPGYDAKRLATNVSLYSHLRDGSDQLGIQALGSFDEDMKISMGFATLIDERISYTISIENIIGLNLENATVYLIDSHNNSIVDLSSGNYTFVSEKGIYDNRFTLQFTPELVLNNAIHDINTVALYPNPTKGTITVSSLTNAIQKVEIRDMLGRIVQSEQFLDETTIQLALKTEESGTYLVSIFTSEGIVFKKLIKE